MMKLQQEADHYLAGRIGNMHGATVPTAAMPRQLVVNRATFFSDRAVWELVKQLYSGEPGPYIRKMEVCPCKPVCFAWEYRVYVVMPSMHACIQGECFHMPQSNLQQACLQHMYVWQHFDNKILALLACKLQLHHIM